MFLKIRFLNECRFGKWYLCAMQKKETIAAVAKGLSLPLMEAFYTLQGEGYHKGSAAYFIRIGGCDVGCHWCDVKESWNSELHPPTDISVIVEEAKNIRIPLWLRVANH